LALVHLARGDADLAASMIADAIEHPVDIPSKERPPFGPLRLAPLLDARAEIAAARGDRETLVSSARELDSIASQYPSPMLRAVALRDPLDPLLARSARRAQPGSSRPSAQTRANGQLLLVRTRCAAPDRVGPLSRPCRRRTSGADGVSCSHRWRVTTG
jgi:hypothetical protein